MLLAALAMASIISGDPVIEHRPSMPYAAVREAVTMQTIADRAPKLIGEVASWLGAHHVPAGGPPFVRYMLIDMSRSVTIEVGFPVKQTMRPAARFRSGVFPSGDYAVYVYTGDYGGLIGANADLQSWCREHRVKLDRRDTKQGTAWGCRFESYEIGPVDQKDPSKWKTSIAYKLAPTRKAGR